VASALTILPQALHLVFKRRVEGLSFLMSFMGVSTMMFWSIYTFRIMDIPAFFSSILPLIIWLTIFVFFLKIDESISFMPVMLSLLFWGLIAGFTFSYFVNYYGLVAAGFSMLWSLPQLYKVVREENFAGISFLAFIGLAAENLGWIIYGLLRSNPTYIYAPLVQGPVALYIAYKVYRFNRDY
jgi:uncharacterized protein with PQ loop repeat